MKLIILKWWPPGGLLNYRNDLEMPSDTVKSFWDTFGNPQDVVLETPTHISNKKQDSDCLSVNVGGGVMIKPAAISSARRGFLQAGVTVWELPSPAPSSNSKAAPNFKKPRASAKPVFWEAGRMLPSQCLQSMQKKTSNNLCILTCSCFQTLGKKRFCELICSLTRPCLGRSLAWNFIPRHVPERAIERLAMGWKLQRASYSYWKITRLQNYCWPHKVCKT